MLLMPQHINGAYFFLAAMINASKMLSIKIITWDGKRKDQLSVLPKAPKVCRYHISGARKLTLIYSVTRKNQERYL